jgi:transcription initiation factor TFIIF subunit alpha
MASMFIKPKKQPPAQPRGLVPNKQQKKLSPNPTPPNGNSPRARSKPRVEESESPMAVDEPGTYTDFKIISCDINSAKFNGFKFDIRKPVKLSEMAKPIKLNRKDPLRREDDTDEVANVPLTPMLGLDGKPVIGADGQMVMVGPDGRPAAQHARPKPTPTPDSKDTKGKRKPFQKKTKQIFTIPEDIRQRRREERYPWMLEDASGKEVWVGQLDDVTKSETHGFLMTMDDDGQGNSHFIFAPSHRWYKMARRPNYRTLGLEEAEEEVKSFSLYLPSPVLLIVVYSSSLNYLSPRTRNIG